MMSKLTLSVDPETVTLAKRYAKKRGLSISGMVEAYLSAVARAPDFGNDAPVLYALRGTLKRANPDDYRKHLSRKYR